MRSETCFDYRCRQFFHSVIVGISGFILFASAGFGPALSEPALARSQDSLPPALKAQLDSLCDPVFDPQHVGRITQPVNIQRDSARFSLLSGELLFFAPVMGHVTGALFRGEASFVLHPPTALERQQLKRFTGEFVHQCVVDELYFRFSDSTFAEIMPQVEFIEDPKIKPGDRPPDKYARRIEDELYWSLGSRLLIDLFNGTTDCLFYAAIDPDNDTRYHFTIEPQTDEAVKLYRRPSTPDTHPIDLACSWPRASDIARFGGRAADIRNDLITSQHYAIETTINEPSQTAITARLDFVPRQRGLRAVRFDLASKLDIDSIVSDLGAVYYNYYDPDIPLNYNAPFPVAGSGGDWGSIDVFWEDPLPLEKTTRISFSYHGKYLLYQFPWGDFYINEATSWYPSHDWRTRTTYDLAFNFSDTREVIAVGEKTEDFREGDRHISRWHMAYPVSYVSFNYGQFEHLEIDTEQGIPRVEVYRSKNHQKGMFNKDMKKKVGQDIAGSLRLFTDIYGPLPFEHLAVTEIPAAHGQGFPQLLHLSYGSFHHEIPGSTELFRAHEVSHQWWGHLIGWKSYHDQWLSESIAEYSGALYVEKKYGFGKELRDILRIWKKSALERGGSYLWHEGPEIAPIWMGGRCSSYDSPGSYMAIIYNKGPYVVHMLRMMMRDFQQGSDDRFIALMRDFVTRYRDSSASTEDFKRVIETHVGGSMDWFFDQWVYGTEIPKLKYSKEIIKTENGKYVVSGKIEQSDVSAPFRIFLPITFDFGNNRRSTFLQEITGWTTEFESPPLPIKPKNVIFNDYQTVMCRE